VIDMTLTLRRSLALGIAAGCVAALSISVSASAVATQADLDALLTRYDREPDGPAKDALATEIDGVAHQKYATVSRLYWHTNLESAVEAARAQGRPILHLRMLGRLDEDLSCANSRLFRATLYANQEISAFLRERFVVSWSSERPVPRVTIDYGDGRRLERTTTGNSAHYVLDQDGNVLDVLPGLYAPQAFRRELEGSLTLATRVRGASDEVRARLIADFHRERAEAAGQDWQLVSDRLRLPLTQLRVEPRAQTELVAAQNRTMTKAMVELRDLNAFVPELAPESVPANQVALWSAMGRSLYSPGDGTSLLAQSTLDRASRSLIERLHDAVPADVRATAGQREAMLARLEQLMTADTALNQLRLRPQISREIVRRGGRIAFASLNAWVYAEVFRTPPQDAWLGLLPRDVFTGLPGDGIVIMR
jgi:hypothetical protein